jgi:hypothetical protein
MGKEGYLTKTKEHLVVKVNLKKHKIGKLIKFCIEGFKKTFG